MFAGKKNFLQEEGGLTSSLGFGLRFGLSGFSFCGEAVFLP
jgi:hypothetical protein